MHFLRLRFSRPLPFAASVLVVFALAAACQQQGAGDVCDPRAGNGGSADCQDGLVCIPISGVNGQRCCPGDPALRTGVCGGSQTSIPADSAAPSGAGTADAGADAETPDEGLGDSFAADAPPDSGPDGADAGDGAPE